MKYLFLFITIICLNGQETILTLTSPFKFYSNNYNDAFRLGKGFAGISDSENFTNGFLNPGLFDQSTHYKIKASLSNKSDIDFIFDQNFYNDSPGYEFSAFIPLLINTQLRIGYEKYNHMVFKIGEIPSPDNPTILKKITITQNFHQFKMSLTQKISPNLSVGLFYAKNQGENSEDYVIFKEKKITKSIQQFGIGLHYILNDQFNFGLAYASKRDFSFVRSIDDSTNIAFQNFMPQEFSFGMNYMIDDDSHFYADIISSMQASRKNYFKTFYINYRLGIAVDFMDDYTFNIGSFTETDSRNADNWINEDGFYTQTYITLGLIYHSSYFNIALSMATSDLISNKVNNQTRFASSIEYTF